MHYAQQTDSSGSVQDFSLSPCSTISATKSTMSPLGVGQESEVTQQLLSLTIGSDLNKSTDSFSSLPDTAHNKGAVAFMELVEAYLAKQADTETAVNFDNLAVQMMEVDLNCMVPTPDSFLNLSTPMDGT